MKFWTALVFTENLLFVIYRLLYQGECAVGNENGSVRWCNGSSRRSIEVILYRPKFDTEIKACPERNY